MASAGGCSEKERVRLLEKQAYSAIDWDGRNDHSGAILYGEKDMTTELTRNDPIVFHFRFDAKAGATVVFLPKEKRFGLAMCCEKDHYNKKWGKHIATIRAQQGIRQRFRRRRFRTWCSYDGPLEILELKRIALELVLEASGATGNPVGSLQSNPWAGIPDKGIPS